MGGAWETAKRYLGLGPPEDYGPAATEPLGAGAALITGAVFAVVVLIVGSIVLDGSFLATLLVALVAGLLWGAATIWWRRGQHRQD